MSVSCSREMSRWIPQGVRHALQVWLIWEDDEDAVCTAMLSQTRAAQ